MKLLQLKLSLIFLCLTTMVFSQSKNITGRVTDINNKTIELVSIKINNTNSGTVTNQKGEFKISVPSGKTIILIFNHINYKEQRRVIEKEETLNDSMHIILEELPTKLKEVEVKADQSRRSNISKIDIKLANKNPSISGGIEDLVKMQAGVSSNNELSSQYSVRGGNYDENLVYVNGIEIYRPFLIRSGQQEGLSFLNSDLVSSIAFSSGGFDAIYGDKMSSVLDIQYKKPIEFGSSVSLGLLNNQLHIEGISKNKKFTYLAGIRHKTNQSLLSGLDTKGDYNPSFYDIQTLLCYHLTEKTELSFLGNYANNKYKLIPSSRKTSFGTFNEAYQFKIYFDGQELDNFETLFGALSLNYNVNKKTAIKFIFSAFQTDEQETYDIQGQYWIGQINPVQNVDQVNNPIELQGIGTHINHARNYLRAVVYNTEIKGHHLLKSQIIDWGLRYQHEDIRDRINEWEMVDSASYSVPTDILIPGEDKPTRSNLALYHSVKASNSLQSNRFIAFAQSKWVLSNQINFTGGIRFNYWDYNKQTLLSPRLNLSYQPLWNNDIVFRFAGGVYYQPPFYKELRDQNGYILMNIKAQKSIHFVSGINWDLKIWNRPFKLVGEIYYKHLTNLIPYKIDNVRISYLPNLTSKGYATGIDFKLNGEFVEGVESWLSFSLLKTQEDIIGDTRTFNYNAAGEQIIPGYTEDDQVVKTVVEEVGYIPRPTDQRFNFSLFFQDYLPNNPTYKVHLRMIFGSRLPFGPPDSEKYNDILRIPPYRRVDIGFSKEISRKRTTKTQKRSLKNFKSIWISAEILNLFQIDNTVSYLWIKDINNRQYAVPNYLTSRQLNIRLIATF